MKQKVTTQELTIMGLLAAVLCVSSYINIPLPISPVPITAQLVVVNMIVLLLRQKKAAITVGVWMVLGMVGLPVFAGGTGGIGVFVGPTGGFVVGYLVMAFVCSVLKEKCKKEYQKLLILIGVGIPIIYIVGVSWMKLVTGIAWPVAWVTGVLPFLPGDILKAVAAVVIAKPLYAVAQNAYVQR